MMIHEGVERLYYHDSQIILLFNLLALFDLSLEKIQVLLQLFPLLADSSEHIDDALGLSVLFLLSNDRQIQASDAENNLSEFPLPLSILVKLSFKL
jgi:hypothetical protein